MASLLDAEYAAALESLLPFMMGMEKPLLHDIETRRTNIEALIGSLFEQIPRPANVDINTHHAQAQDGFSIPIVHYRRNDSTRKGLLPAILHIHGGGHIALSVATYRNLVATLADATDVQMFSVDYRLAPEHPFPTPIEDCYDGLLWLHEHAQEFNVDTARVAVFGDSAGGGLAACLAIMARDRQLAPPLAKQILIYPMLDDRNQQPSPLEQYMTWNSEDNLTGWMAYVGEEAGKDGVSPYAAAARVQTVEGLPRTYLDVGTVDLFRDEDIRYVSRLVAAEVEVEFHLYPGVAHAFDAIAPGTGVVNRAVANRIRALTSF